MADNWIRQHLAGTLSLGELEQIRPKTSKVWIKLEHWECMLFWVTTDAFSLMAARGLLMEIWSLPEREGGKRGKTSCPLPGDFGQERKGMATLTTLSLWLYNCFLVLPRQVRYASLHYFSLSSNSAYVYILIFLSPVIHLEYFFWRSLF